MKRATLFDFNGVLVDDEHVHFEAFREVLSPLGVNLALETYNERYLGFDDAGAFTAILTDAGRTPDASEVARLIEAKKPAYMRRVLGSLRVFPGAPEAVEHRASLGIVAVVSGALRSEIEHGLDRMGSRQHVSFVVAAEDTRECKPDPEGYLIATERLRASGVECEGIVVVEDSVAGVEAAKRAGLFCVAVTHSYPALALEKAGADRVIEALDELRSAVG